MSNLIKHTQEDEDGTITVYQIWDTNTDSEGTDYDAYCQFELRRKRNVLLLATDWWAGSDLTITSEQTAYRTALRDLPSTATPALDSDGQLTGVTWPVKPS